MGTHSAPFWFIEAPTKEMRRLIKYSTLIEQHTPHVQSVCGNTRVWWVYYILKTFFFQKTDFIKTKVAGCKGT
jgi:hypothetical protein